MKNRIIGYWKNPENSQMIECLISPYSYFGRYDIKLRNYDEDGDLYKYVIRAVPKNQLFIIKGETERGNI